METTEMDCRGAAWFGVSTRCTQVVYQRCTVGSSDESRRGGWVGHISCNPRNRRRDSRVGGPPGAHRSCTKVHCWFI